MFWHPCQNEGGTAGSDGARCNVPAGKAPAPKAGHLHVSAGLRPIQPHPGVDAETGGAERACPAFRPVPAPLRSFGGSHRLHGAVRHRPARAGAGGRAEQPGCRRAAKTALRGGIPRRAGREPGGWRHPPPGWSRPIPVRRSAHFHR